MRRLDIDAFPDTTPVQVQINTVAPALSPEEIEQQITFPVEQALSGLPRLESLRSISKFGLSQVVITFDDDVDIYFARQVVNERLTTVVLPRDRATRMGLVATGLGEVLHYVVTGAEKDLTKPHAPGLGHQAPSARRGVAEVKLGAASRSNSRSAPTRRTRAAQDHVRAGARRGAQNNKNVGGGNAARPRNAAGAASAARARSTTSRTSRSRPRREGVLIKVRDVADVVIGHEVRRGAVTADGKGEVVLGLGFMLMGENSHEVTHALKQKLAEVKAGLPKHVEVEPVYDRTELVDFVIDTVRGNLFEAGLLVVAVLFLFLGNLRAAFIVALAIPLSMLFAFTGMLRFGIAASLLSLGAIDFGMIVDSSVVMVENCVRHLAEGDKSRTKLEVIRDAAVEVRKPTLFGELIIMIVYLPILTLEGVEGKMFRPMALTVICALAGSMVLSMTLMPVLASFLLPRKIAEREPLFMRIAHAIHNPILRFSMKYKKTVLGVAALILFVTFGPRFLTFGAIDSDFGIAPSLGSEFVPTLSEGAIVMGVVRLPDTPIERSIEENTRIEQAILKAFPDEVRHIWSRVGSAEIATDPMGVEETDIFISLYPRSRWTKAATQAELTEQIEKEIQTIRGARFAFSQPIKQRIDEMTSGARADLAVKLFGDDIKTLQTKAAEIEKVLKSIDGAADVNVEPLTGLAILQVKVKPDVLARHGLSAQIVLDVVEALAGTRLSEVVEGDYRFPLVVRLPEDYRGLGKSAQDARDLLKEMPIITAKGERLPLSTLATVEVLENSPSTVTREWGRRRITVSVNVRGRDLGGFVKEATKRLEKEVRMPSERYHLEFGGQWEHLISARNRLLIVIPIAALLICGLLYLTYGNFIDMLRVFTAVPFGAVGGIIALWVRGMPFSISAAIGFIAMSGVAVLDDMILVSYIRQLRRKGTPLDEAVRQAAVTRLRPVLMTTLVASLGFVPMAFSTGMGAEVQRPLATVVIGGVISAMVMSLFVVRVLYVVFQSPVDKEEAPAEPDARRDREPVSV
ncbi:MAG: CusA/CzcA family heavy metal efflux RND transporter [Gemmataceae bacterium]